MSSNGPKRSAKLFSLLDKISRHIYHLTMENVETLRQRVHREQQLIARLRAAAVRLADAQQERMWAIVSAHQQGLSMRQIGTAAGLSATRVHQILTGPDASELPMWLSRLREQAWPVAGSQEGEHHPTPTLIAARLTDEVTALRQCIGWLEQLERGEGVVVNLPPATEAETEFVPFDRPRVLRVLQRIAADLDDLGRAAQGDARSAAASEEDPEARHRRSLAEPPPQPTRLSPREERAMLRAAVGLPPE